MKCSAVTMIAFVTLVVGTPALAQNHESTLAALILKSYKLLPFDSQVMDDFEKYLGIQRYFQAGPIKNLVGRSMLCP